MVGRVDGLGEVAPAGERGDAVLAEELDGGEHVGAGREESAVAECAEDAGVVGRGGAQVEELAFGGGDGLVEEVAQFVGVLVELLGREGALGGTRCGLRGGGCGSAGVAGALAGEPGVRAAAGRLSSSASRSPAAMAAAARRSAW